ncbi:MAG TPA: zinc dependent phospholipase C family protein [Flavobacteriales bacterium]|nr:S1/P1 Nuclease [Flavobacteriales bacterium]HMU13422.1 zinc dependent phospholipase C family protein [Flavobacteriales bacterium]HNI04393.1 zinc dependent phospholipase C family protein [Flavobacteriales bacterium]HNK69634.1 zinc dependent phospholipase C family protein [Flavobacteriales bacterium]HNM69459.1 zinc dependent phospholipase C family protein [Flavobacteriales bacterium]
MIRSSVLKTIAILAVVAACWPFATSRNADAWGFFGHKRINRMACFTLPPAMFGFYKRHIDFISDHAPDPDRRRYAVPEEAARHYIDIDHYVKPGEDPFSVVPRTWDMAVAKFGEDTLQAYGIVPWHIPVVYGRLVRAFQRGDVDRILYYSAELGHYVGDAHVPLHTTENYNGQLTNQHGIHAFWESRIPELSAELNYDHLVGRATYIDDPLGIAWDAVRASHAEVDSVLGIERALNERFPEDLKYVFEDRGRGVMRFQSQEFTRAYEDAMGDMVERRMNASIITLGCFWYSAWVDAGQPDLDRYEQKDVSDSLKMILAAEDEVIKMAKQSLGRPEPNE